MAFAPIAMASSNMSGSSSLTPVEQDLTPMPDWFVVPVILWFLAMFIGFIYVIFFS
jgi:hypothetical protein